MLSLIPILKQQFIKHINEKYKTEINTENCPYYFFSDIINIKNFDPNLLNIDKNSKLLLLFFTTLDTSQ